ncbi:MAG: hypothetical protein GY854_29110 [Deltaproteobacteria bacterium]|nr:hypothetical protein [Deltaproteobacteria bacterium]
MNRNYLVMLVFSMIIAASGCGSAKTDPSGPEDSAASDPSTNPEENRAITEADPPPASLPPGAILRSDLDEVLVEGPAGILGRALTEPVFKDGRFQGFRITAFPRGDPTAIDLRVGDVILKVNGRSVERPENYYDIFQELKVATELRFELQRDGAAQTLVYPVVTSQ